MRLIRLLSIISTIMILLIVGGSSEISKPIQRPVAIDSPVYAMQKCRHPLKGVLPTGVVIQYVSGGTYLIRKPEVIGTALDAAISGKEWRGVRVIAFCK